MGLEFKLKDGQTIIDLLGEKGWTQKRIREHSKIGTRTFYELKENKVPGVKGIAELCRMLSMQPGSFLKYVPDKEENA